MIKKFTILLSLLATAAVAGAVFAQETNIQYPVPELGNCKDKAECKTFCDDPQNTAACVEFAKKNKLMSEDELKKAGVFLQLGNKGPGGCNTKEECDQYCDNSANIKECVTFATQNGLLTGQELEEAKKMLAAIEKGAVPPPCKGKKECDAYCENPSHMEECINFGVQAGFIQGKELEDAQKMLAAIKKGAVPPKCKGKEECDAYCQQDAHFEECMNFSIAAGLMDPKDAELAKKTKGKGPGGCKGKEECDAFCNNPANQDTCFQFGMENGLIAEADLKKMEEGKQQMEQSMTQAPPEVVNCLQSKLGAETIDRIKNGQAMPSQTVGETMKQCFEQFMPMMQGQGEQMGPGQQSGMGMGNSQPFAGPGGCKGPEECKNYCTKNPDECKNFQPPANDPINMQNGTPEMPMNGGQIPQMSGPGGCKSPEECQNYCQSNPQACQNFAPPAQGTGMPQMQMQPPIPMMGGDAPNINNTENIPGRPTPMQNMVPPVQMQNGGNAGSGPMPPIPQGMGMDGNQPGPMDMQAPMPQAPMNQPPAAPPAEATPPTPVPPSSFLNPDSLLGSLIRAYLSIFGF